MLKTVYRKTLEKSRVIQWIETIDEPVFESATSTNSITPAGAENIIHNISPLGKSENEIRSYN